MDAAKVQTAKVDTPPGPAKAAPREKRPAGYTGPEDGQSHPWHQDVFRAIDKAVLPLMYREHIQGREKLPLAGAQVYCYDHPSTIEPLLMVKEVNRDVRSIALDSLFVGPLGPLLTAGGAYPVDRDKPSTTTVKHSVEILKQGLGLSIAGAGRTSPDPLVVPPMHTGPAGFAIMGGAENITPVTFFYHPDAESRPGEKALGYLAAAVTTAAGMTAVVLGAPLLAAAAATTGAVLGGAYLAAHVADRFEPKEYSTRALKKLGINLGAGLAGATAAGVGTALALASAPVAAPVLIVAGVVAGGLGVLGLARAWRTRDVAEMVVGDPIPVKPYVEKFGKREAITKLTEDVHRALGHTKALLTGVPYDESAPKITSFQPESHPTQPPVAS